MTGSKNDDNTRNTPHAPPVLSVDYDLYAQYLEDTSLSEEQKREFLEALWSIICDFVALGFNVHPAQQAQNACGKLRENRTNLPISMPDAVGLDSQIQRKSFNAAADGNAHSEAERIQK
tara:strand:- start:510 stop:866 length:357 start_codon:yes stop_codon:yes gene_type:complete